MPFSFEFWYKDLKPVGSDAQESVKGYNIVTKDVTGKSKFLMILTISVLNITVEEEADLLWVYILGGSIGACILLCSIYLYCSYRIQRSKERKELQMRAEGKITQSWGIRTTNIDVIKREEEAEAAKHNFKSNDTSQDQTAQYLTGQITRSESNFWKENCASIWTVTHSYFTFLQI